MKINNNNNHNNKNLKYYLTYLLIITLTIYLSFILYSNNLNISQTSIKTIRSSNLNSNNKNNKELSMGIIWPHSGYNQYGNRHSPFKILNQSMKVLWSTKKIGTISSIPIVHDKLDYVYCTTIDGIVALNLTNGSIIWSYISYFRISNPVLSIDDKLYVIILDCLYCFDAINGKIIWKTCFSTDFNLDLGLSLGYMNSPIISNYTSTVLFGIGCMIYSVRLNDGKLLWKIQLGTSIKTQVIHFYPIINSKGSFYVIISGNKIINGQYQTIVYELSLLNGDIKWEQHFIDQSFSSLLLIELNAYESHLIVSCGSILYSYNTHHYFQEWKYDFKDQIGLSSPVFNPKNNSIIISTTSSIVYSLNIDGSLQWLIQLELNKNLARNNLNTPIIDSNGNIYVTNSLGKLYVINDHGDYLWSRNPLEKLRIFSHPIIPSKNSLLIIENCKLIEDENNLDQNYHYMLTRLIVS